MLGPGNARYEELKEIVYTSPTRDFGQWQKKVKQGSIFTQKPRLACVECNTGWMKQFEDEILKFGEPIFTGTKRLQLTYKETQVLVGWLSLITILAEYIDRSRNSVCITDAERIYLKKFLLPPNHWSIFIATLEKSAAWYRHRATHLMTYSSLSEYHLTLSKRPRSNTQISSFAIGKLHAQVFSCPTTQNASLNYQIWAKAKGLVQIWPIPFRIWPFKKGYIKIPTELISDDDAETFADRFKKQLDFMTDPLNAPAGRLIIP